MYYNVTAGDYKEAKFTKVESATSTMKVKEGYAHVEASGASSSRNSPSIINLDLSLLAIDTGSTYSTFDASVFMELYKEYFMATC